MREGRRRGLSSRDHSHLGPPANPGTAGWTCIYQVPSATVSRGPANQGNNSPRLSNHRSFEHGKASGMS